jgi:hypothetical protein
MQSTKIAGFSPAELLKAAKGNSYVEQVRQQARANIPRETRFVKSVDYVKKNAGACDRSSNAAYMENVGCFSLFAARRWYSIQK